MLMVPVSAEEEIGKPSFLKSNLREKQSVCQFCYLSAVLKFSDHIVRQDNLSVHVQETNTRCESSKIHLKLSYSQHVPLLSGSDCSVTKDKLYW